MFVLSVARCLVLMTSDSDIALFLLKRLEESIMSLLEERFDPNKNARCHFHVKSLIRTNLVSTEQPEYIASAE